MASKHLTARDFVLEGIRDAMLSGDIEAGEELDDQLLADSFGVSRTPVREALKVLEIQGFVTHRPFSKPMVAAVSPQRIEEVLLMRIALEGAAVARSALTIEEAELKYLETCAESGNQALLKHDGAAWSRYNREFHTRLAAAAGMPLLSREIDSLINLSSFFSSMFWNDIPEAFADAQLHHLGVVRACRVRDSVLAQKLMQEHLLASCGIHVQLARQREEEQAAVATAALSSGGSVGKNPALRGAARRSQSVES